MAYHTANNQIRITKIRAVRNLSPTVKSFTFKDKICAKAKPGHFLMLWIPGVDEIPLSIANVNGAMISVAVKKVGEATSILHKLKIGDAIGVRGPFGNCFHIKKAKALLVGGGTGIAPLLFLAEQLKLEGAKLVFIVGAKEREELLFVEEIEKLCSKANVIAVTEDGSYGIKGLATTPLQEIFEKEKFDIIYTCGPERMMYEVFKVAEKYGLPLEASLERLMRCAIGLCGSCVIGKYRVCRDGPVFTAEQLRGVKGEFGLMKRDFTGKHIPLE